MDTEFMSTRLPFCTTTHPQQPIKSPNARSRKIHLIDTKKLSKCNRLITESFLKEPIQRYITGVFWNERRLCKICFPSPKQRKCIGEIMEELRLLNHLPYEPLTQDSLEAILKLKKLLIEIR